MCPMAYDCALCPLIANDENKLAYNTMHMLCARRLVILLIDGNSLINHVDEYN